MAHWKKNGLVLLKTFRVTKSSLQGRERFEGESVKTKFMRRPAQLVTGAFSVLLSHSKFNKVQVKPSLFNL